MTGGGCPFHVLALRYAQASDRRDGDALLALFDSQGVIEMPGMRLEGHEQLASVPGILANMFVATQHKVHNVLVDTDGDRAQGEVYCTASHLRENEQGLEVEDWAIRYQDEYIREGEQWRYLRRELVVDWVERRPAEKMAAP